MSITNEIISLVEKSLCGAAECGARPYMNRVTHGDCIQLMQNLPGESVDMVFTDPPYLVKYRERGGRKIVNDDNSQWILPAFREAYRVLKPDTFCISFYGWNHVDKFLCAWRDAGFKPVGHFTWVKNNRSSVGYSQMWHECAYLLVKGRPPRPTNPPADVLPWKYTGNKLHPTQKPVASLTPLIEAYSKRGAVVLDPFGGSGSTAVAARACGRQFILFEIDKGNYETAQMRLLSAANE